jgi:hypothetical protein
MKTKTNLWNLFEDNQLLETNTSDTLIRFCDPDHTDSFEITGMSGGNFSILLTGNTEDGKAFILYTTKINMIKKEQREEIIKSLDALTKMNPYSKNRLVTALRAYLGV